MKRKGFAFGAVILAASAFVAKIFGAIYRIPLTNLLGAEGIGLYQLAFPILALLLTLSSGAIPMTIGKILASRKALNQTSNGDGIMFASLLYMIACGMLMSILFLALAPFIAIGQGQVSLRLCYYVLAPTVFIVALESVFKGWFIGTGNLVPNAIVQIAEQVVKLVGGLIMAKLLLPKGLTYAIIGALLGTTLAELVSLLTYVVLFLTDKSRNKTFARVDFKENVSALTKSALPLGALGLIFPLAAFIDSFIIVNMLGSSLERVEATSRYGLLTGVVNPLINMPVVIAMALAIAIVPTAASSFAVGDLKELRAKACMCMKMSYVIAIPCFFGIYALADDFLTMLYPSLSGNSLSIATGLMKVASINILLISQLQLYNSLLQALDRTKQALLNLMIALVFRVGLTILLTKYWGINGACIASVIFYLIALVLNSIYFKILLGEKKALSKNISKILALGVIMFMAVLLSTYFISSHTISVAVGLAVGITVYFAGIILWKVFEDNEWKSIPFGNKILALINKKKGASDGENTT